MGQIMLVICFPGGGFGHTIEYSIKHFSQEHGPIEDLNPLTSTGSMHNYWLENLVINYDKSILEEIDRDRILSIHYPTHSIEDYHVSTDNSFKYINSYLTEKDKVIFVYCKSLGSVELITSMLHEKVDDDALMALIDLKCARAWNPEIKKVTDLEIWQLRELLSIQFNNKIDAFLNVDQHIKKHWFSVTPEEIVQDLSGFIDKAISYVGWSRNSIDSSIFVAKWRENQDKIIVRQNLIDDIINNTLSNSEMNWDKLNLIDECHIQARLLRQGYELKCHGLNIFPTNSVELIKLLVNA